MRQRLSSAWRAVAITVMSIPLWATSFSADAASDDPIVIGMTFDQNAPSGRGFRAISGVKAYLGRANAAGGVQGRKLVLETLDDEGKPDRIAANMRTLVEKYKAVAIMGCMNDAMCETMAPIATELKVPLLGALSGLSVLSRKNHPYVFRNRPDYPKEIEAVVLQMVQMGQSSVAVLSDGSNGAEVDELLQKAMASHSMKFEIIRVNPAQPDSLVAAMKRIGGNLGSNYHSCVMNISGDTVAAFVDQGLSVQPGWPRMLMALSTGNLSILIRHFKGRGIGFSMVVPNPEVLVSSLSREIDQDADQYAGSSAITFDGMELYLGTRLLVEALKQVPGREISPQRLFTILDTTDVWNLGGFNVSFRKGRATGSDWIEMGLRSGSGWLVR